MIELFLLLFVIQGDTPGEWLQSCYDQFDPESDYLTPDIFIDPNDPEYKDWLFCRFTTTLDLNEHDLEKLGRDFNWYNYVNQTAQEFVNSSEYYQNNVIRDVMIEPVVSGRDSLPPPMSVVISHNEMYGDQGISRYYKIYNANPSCNPEVYDVICHTDMFDTSSNGDIQGDAFDAYYKLNLELSTNPDFKKLVDTKLGGFGPMPDGIFVNVNSKYVDTYQLFRYQDAIREIVGPDVSVTFIELPVIGLYCPSTHVAVDGQCQPVNYIDPLYWVALIALVPVVLISVFVLKSKNDKK